MQSAQQVLFHSQLPEQKRVDILSFFYLFSDWFSGAADPSMSESVVGGIMVSRAGPAREAAERSMPEFVRLFASSLADEELANHPLLVLLRSHGSRSWEDSLL